MDPDSEIARLFPGEDTVDLYAVLSLTSDASPEAIRKSYRKLALIYHPDKHSTHGASQRDPAAALTRFQQIGFAYAVLSDEKRRKTYDRTGSTGEGMVDPEDEGGWEAYFQDLFDSVTRGKLDEMKAEYQGSEEEVDDLVAAYNDTEGSLDEIMKHIPHSTIDDEPRFIQTISQLITQGKLSDLPLWRSTSADEKAKLVRKKQAAKESKEAEELAKELGVWDEFYGSGKVGARKGKGKQKEKDDEGDGDVSALQALILQRQKARNGLLDNLAAKYVDMDEEKASRKKGKKRKKASEQADPEETESPQKRHRSAPAEMDEEEITQSKPKSRTAKASAGTDKAKKGTRSKKAK